MGFDISSLIGGSIGDAFAKIVGAFKVPPEQVLAAKVETDKIQAELTEKFMDANAMAIEAVNATMQAEAKSEHWAQWMWRPTVGFTFCAILVNNYILVGYVTWAKPVSVPEQVWYAILVILGAASGLRGWQKIQQAQADNK